MLEKWVIFDGDNTLWDIEHLYDQARAHLCDYLHGYGIEKSEVEAYQRSRDLELVRYYGYSACRFPRSFEDTAIYFLGVDKTESIIHVRGLAGTVFERDATYQEGLELIISDLKSKYRIMLLTAGEAWVQEKRIAKFQLAHMFDAVEIVQNKSAQVFGQMLEKFRMKPVASWMIGDSINSDVLPSLQVGLNAIWFRNKNWEYESRLMSGRESWEDGKFHTIDKVQEILKILM